jgi:plastocyanin
MGSGGGMRSKTRTPLAIALVLAALALSACGGGSDGDVSTDTGGTTATTSEPNGGSEPAASGNAPAPSGEAVRSAKVRISDFAYDPDPVTIQVGGKVTWLNEDAAPHTATAKDGSFDTGVLEEGKLKSETFKEAGTFTYICTIHPGMHGVVEVVDKD